MSNVLVLYHSNCLDGLAAAWVIKSHYKDAECIPVQYQQEPPDVKGREVIIVDFSYKRDVLKKLKRQAKSLVVIDHHKSAQEDLEDLDYCLFDMTKSGCGLAWEWVYPEAGEYLMPRILKHIQDRDLWKFEYPNTREINTALFSYPMTIETLDEFIKDENGWERLALEGQTLLRAHDKTVELLCKRPRRMKIRGYEDIPVVNCNTQYSSDVGNVLAKENLFAATYCDIPEGRIFSFRSVGEFDVSEIAGAFGGGGHRNAAGAKIPFEDVIRLNLM
jgi:oligoribonuclease NrnB/cAMP/cGMP phosphodiesterase (DHH superfamily)